MEIENVILLDLLFYLLLINLKYIDYRLSNASLSLLYKITVLPYKIRIVVVP